MAVEQIPKERAFVNSYLPRILIDWYAKAQPGSFHNSTHYKGLVACLDASGFTALTRELSIDKKLGPEILTTIINEFFKSVTDLIFYFQGDVLKYAGDAIWIYFPDTIDITQFHSAALRSINDLNRRTAELKQSPIGIHIGAETGSFCLSSMGRDGVRMEVEPLGPMINDVMVACDLAKTGQMVLGSHLARQLPQFESMIQPEAGFYLLENRDQFADITLKTKPATSAENLPHDNRLEQYLPVDIIERAKLISTSAISQSEFRDVTVLVINFRTSIIVESDCIDNELKTINDGLTSVFKTISESGGSIARIDPFYEGHKLMVLFGAPHKHEDDELNALSCATKLLEETNSDIELRLGLAYGSLFCGDVGTDQRREYTVMGEAVNMAARLMASAAWSTVLIDDQLRNRLPEQIKTDKKTLALKGLGQGVVCHQFIEIVEAQASHKQNNGIVGRQSELEQLSLFINQPPLAQTRIMTITGEAGVGKSTLIDNVIGDSNANRTISVTGRHSFLYGHAWVAKKLLHELFSMFQSERYQSLNDLAAEKIEATWLPLIADILDVPFEKNIWTKGLSQKQRNQKAIELYGQLAASMLEEPILIVIDDFDQIDDYSKTLLLALLDQPEQFVSTFIILLRDSSSVSELLKIGETDLKLSSPPSSDWRVYFASAFADGKRERELTERLIDISKGNPQFISEFIDHLRQQNQLIINDISGKYELIESLSDTEIPGSVNDIYLSRFDLLSEPDRVLLKSAAIFAIMFSSSALSAVTKSSKTAITRQLESLVDKGILAYDSEERLYSFVEYTFRSIIYSCLPESYLLASHTKVAEYLASTSVAYAPSVLANHYFKSEQWPKAFSSSLTAANDARSLFNLSEASLFFKQCEVSLESSNENDIPAEDAHSFYTGYTSYLILEGDLDKAYLVLRVWEESAAKDGNKTQQISAILKKAQLDWQQSKYTECRTALEGVLSYPDIKKYTSMLARVHAILAEVERRSGNFSLARECCRLSIGYYQDLGDKQGLSDTYNKLGLALWGEGKLIEAAEIYELSLKYGKDVNGMIVHAQTSNNLAIINWEQGDFVKAEQLMNEALDINKQIGDRRHEAYVSGNLSSIQNILGRFCSSRKLLLQADKIFIRLNDTHAHNYVVGNLGDIDLIEGKIEEAEAKFREVICFAKEVEDKELLAECQIRLGECLFYSGNIELAERKYNEAIEFANQIDSSEYFMRSAIGLCRLYIGECYLKNIDKLIEQTLDKATKSNSILVKNEIGFITGEVNRLNSNLTVANRCYHETLKYALQQSVFELTLKACVRLYENDSSFKSRTSEIVSGLHLQFEIDNGPGSWVSLMASPYYQFFAKTIGQMV